MRFVVDWRSLFDEAEPAAGATDAEIDRFAAALVMPLSAAEIDEINQHQQNPFPENHPLHASYRPLDPAQWIMPQRPLSQQYRRFLSWSNGGWCSTGDREFGFFGMFDPRGGVRAMTVAYHLPHYMPDALPFAFDGGGTFLLFDMRRDALDGEYPIVCASSGNLGWHTDAHWRIAESFVEACRDGNDIHGQR